MDLPTLRTKKSKGPQTASSAYLILQYYMWSSEWTMEDLQELDRRTRAVIAQKAQKGKHNS